LERLEVLTEAATSAEVYVAEASALRTPAD
jgi:hypothetical protein